LGYLPELTMFVVENNPIRRKKFDQPDTKSMLTYLKTKDSPHPSLVGASSNSPEEIMLAQKMRDASHYGILTIDIDPKKNKKEQPLSTFPLKVYSGFLFFGGGGVCKEMRSFYFSEVSSFRVIFEYMCSCDS